MNCAVCGQAALPEDLHELVRVRDRVVTYVHRPVVGSCFSHRGATGSPSTQRLRAHAQQRDPCTGPCTDPATTAKEGAMTRRPCLKDGCPKLTDGRTYCAEHQREVYRRDACRRWGKE